MTDDLPEPPAGLLANFGADQRRVVVLAWRAGFTAGAESAAGVGPMLAAVRADLGRMKVDEVPAGRTLATMAQWLAGVIDKRGSEEGPSTTAKLADQLGRTMAALTRRAGGDDDGFDGQSADLSTPSVG